MDIAFLLGTKIIELTLIVLIGYGLVKSKLLKSEDSKPTFHYWTLCHQSSGDD